ncbi:MAG: uracil-DNA glycosylase [Armatimonadota bacterium]
MSEEAVARIQQLAQQAAGCQRCGLSATRRTVVFGEGNADTPLVLIGEGPGEHEDATGRPFVGRAGALLDQVLRENGMTRKHVYICNVVKCRPAVIEGGRSRNRVPTSEEVEACKPWLVGQLDAIRPLVIVCLGASAANVVIRRNFRMTQERGQWFESPYAPHAIATFHPAYVLRLHGEAFQTARQALSEDIAAARQKVIEARNRPKLSLFDLLES